MQFCIQQEPLLGWRGVNRGFSPSPQAVKKQWTCGWSRQFRPVFPLTLATSSLLKNLCSQYQTPIAPLFTLRSPLTAEIKQNFLNKDPYPPSANRNRRPLNVPVHRPLKSILHLIQFLGIRRPRLDQRGCISKATYTAPNPQSSNNYLHLRMN